MSIVLPKIDRPELFFPVVAPIGTPLDTALAALEGRLNKYGYQTVNVRVTDLFQRFERIITPDHPLDRSSRYNRYKTYIAYGNQLRKTYDEDAILAVTAMSLILGARAGKETVESPGDRASGRAYIIRQFKRREEIELLRSVYGDQLFQISIYSRQTARVRHLAEEFAKDAGRATADEFRSKAEEIVHIDRDEQGIDHGQQVGKVFHDADIVLDVDQPTEIIEKSVYRFCDLLFGANNISPSRDEYGMRLAKSPCRNTS